MTDIPETPGTDVLQTYLGKGDPAGRFADYHPAWVEKHQNDLLGESVRSIRPAR